MDQVFIVFKNYQGSDGDEYVHWVATTIYSYHKTWEGAQQAVLDLLEDELKATQDFVDKNIDKYPNIAGLYIKEFPSIMLNQIRLTTELNGHEPFETYPMFDIDIQPLFD